MKNIECEIRSFIAPEKYRELFKFFSEKCDISEKDTQTTYYFDAPEDLRIQLNNNFSKIWLKKGKIHDEHREEIEIRGDKQDFEKMEKLFLTLGYNISIKWFRERYAFKWGDIDLALDYTRGYGYIIELEKMSDEEHKMETTDYLKSKLEELGIPLTPKEEFNDKYKYYKENWQKLTAE